MGMRVDRMKSKPVAEKSPLDTPKLLLAVAIIATGIFGFYFYSDESVLLRVLGLLVMVGIAGGIILTTALGRSLWGFVVDSRSEPRKVVWPTRQVTTQTTIIVLVVVMIVAIFLWLLDVLLRWGVAQLMQLGG